MNAHLEGEQAYLGDYQIMVINHLLNGMIPEVIIFTSPEPRPEHFCRAFQ